MCEFESQVFHKALALLNHVATPWLNISPTQKAQYLHQVMHVKVFVITVL